jgi:hypothetical protein
VGDDITVAFAVERNATVDVVELVRVCLGQIAGADTADLFANMEDIQARHTSLNQPTHDVATELVVCTEYAWRWLGHSTNGVLDVG